MKPLTSKTRAIEHTWPKSKMTMSASTMLAWLILPQCCLWIYSILHVLMTTWHMLLSNEEMADMNIWFTVQQTEILEKLLGYTMHERFRRVIWRDTEFLQQYIIVYTKMEVSTWPGGVVSQEQCVTASGITCQDSGAWNHILLSRVQQSF